MKVYRNNLYHFETIEYFPAIFENGKWYSITGNLASVQPTGGEIFETGAEFLLEFPNDTTIEPLSYYLFSKQNMLDYDMANQQQDTNQYIQLKNVGQQYALANAVFEIIDIMEWQYNGKDMGERSVNATIKHPTPIDFRKGDYVTIPMQTLLNNIGQAGAVGTERFYLYTQPTVEKNARPMSSGDAFIHNVTFYPPQYELGTVLMRDIVQQQANADNIIYTGFDNLTFYGGAYELLKRCTDCLTESGLVDYDRKPLWKFELAEELNENKNTALERYTFSFNGNSVADAIAKLGDKDFINTKFFINGRTIYAGLKRPYLCRVDEQKFITQYPLKLTYGKTSHKTVALDHGGLFKITKSPSKELPVTKLFAYGAARNLNRYYCADRIQSGRFVNKLMLPSFSDDGHTDYILSEDGVAKFGMREGKKEFEDIYPSLRYMTYADIRGVKYCIKIKYNGLDDGQFNGKQALDKNNSITSYAVARVQCYQVICNSNGINTLLESAPPEDLAVFVHATGKTVKCILYAAKNGKTAKQRQIENDYYVPCTQLQDLQNRTFESYIPGSCFAVHDIRFDDNGALPADRENWFKAPTTATTDSGSELHRIEYVDTFWATDLYVFQAYNQTSFKRDGYSLWAYPRINNNYQFAHDDSLPVNELVAVEPITITDTSSNQSTRQHTWDIYLRDLGFAIDEQNDFGDMVFVVNGTVTVSILDGLLAGREFTIDGSELNDFQSRCLCAYNEDGSVNQDFFLGSGYTDQSIPQNAFNNGAIWRIRLNRKEDDANENLGLILPAKTTQGSLEAKAGDHIVLLDIYMPDIYVRAAENKLLYEATKYLERNSKSNTGYAVEFDKVRIQQIPNYPLQMREGLNLRIIDDDLDINTNNNSRYLYNNPSGTETVVKLYTSQQTQTESYKTTTIGVPAEGTDTTINAYLKGWTKKNWERYLILNEDFVSGNKTLYRMQFVFPRTNLTSSFDYIILKKYTSPMYTRASLGGDTSQMEAAEIQLGNAPSVEDTRITSVSPTEAEDGTLQWTVNIQLSEQDGNIFSKVFDLPTGRGTIEHLPIEILYEEQVLAVTTEDVAVENEQYNACCNTLVDFKADKTYEVVIDADNAYIPDNAGDVEFLLINNIGTNGYIYIPEYRTETIVDSSNREGYRRLKFTFSLDDSFNDSCSYYPTIKYTSKGTIETANIYLLSVNEKDVNADEQVLKYVDMAVESVTIKVQEDTRSVIKNVPGGTPIRKVSTDTTKTIHPEPYREVTATLKESTNASPWTTLQNEIAQNAIEIEKNIRNYEALANFARQNYKELLSLKDNIFDPDGTCSQTFLQVMMLQVGADSMNYQLEKTYQTVGGVRSNYYVGGIDDKGYANDMFIVFAQDKLHHFVYTKGAQGGDWEITYGIEKILTADSSNTYPTYFICLKCLKDGGTGEWVVSTKQYAVNDEEDTNYWYFNWGILTCPNQDGRYTLRETRGNAYMYGDNLICGKISTLVGNSYFDLTHGNFVLSKGTEGSAELSYIDGVLTIKGAIDDSQIGGENLCNLEENTIVAAHKVNGIWENDGISIIDLLPLNGNASTTLPAGQYVLTAKFATVTSNTTATFELLNGGSQSIGSLILEEGSGNGNGVYSCTFTLAVASSMSLKCKIEPIEEPSAQDADLFIRIENIMLQRGTKSTSYQPYVEHLVRAIKGTTQINGGLVMTNLLMLKDEQDNVKAGMSGLTDNGQKTAHPILTPRFLPNIYSPVYNEQENIQVSSEGVTLWGGGTYANALDQAMGLLDSFPAAQLPVLLTKTGIRSQIGCFRVESPTAVSVIGYNGDKILIEANDNGHPSISMYDNNILKFKMSTDELTKGDAVGNTFDSGGQLRTGTLMNELVEGVNYDIPNSIDFTLIANEYPSYAVGGEITKISVRFRHPVFGGGASYSTYKSYKIYGFKVSLYNTTTKHEYVLINTTIQAANVTNASTDYPEEEGGGYGVQCDWFGITSIDLPQSVTSGVYKIRISFDRASGYSENDFGGTETENIQTDNTFLFNGFYIYGGLTFTGGYDGGKVMRIGSNGFVVSGKAGYVQVLNEDESSTYVSMHGLPLITDAESLSSLKSGQLYRTSNNEIKIKVGG